MEKIFAFVGNRLGQLDSREILCVHRPKVLIVSAGPRYQTLKDWIRCLYNNVIDRLFDATSQLTNDPRIQTLRLDTKQLLLIGDQTLH